MVAMVLFKLLNGIPVSFKCMYLALFYLLAQYIFEYNPNVLMKEEMKPRKQYFWTSRAQKRKKRWYILIQLFLIRIESLLSVKLLAFWP